LVALQSRGVTPIIVTGRTETAAMSVSDDAALTAPVVSCNGAVVSVPGTGERLLVAVLDPATVDRIVGFAMAQRLEPLLWTAGEMFARAHSDATSLLELINQQRVTIAPLDRIPRDAVVKVMLSGSRERLDDVGDLLGAELPLLRRSMDVFYETNHPGATKSEALRLVLERLGIAPRHCMGLADGDTDVGWMREVGLPVALENSRPAIRRISRIQIGNHADDAVAKFLAAYFDLS
jgi:hydroxymethylpyrimidine pyrophosphatase-like HAD family hydrolase